MDIPLVNLVFTLEKGRGRLQPAALFAGRLTFSAAFRRAVGCSQQGDSCTAGADCPCRITFSQELTPDPAALRRYQKPSLPFAFRFPAPLEDLQPGDIVEFSLALVGVAVNHLEIYIAAVKGVLPPALRLLSIAAVAADGGRRILAVNSGRVDTSVVPVTSFEELMGQSPSGASALRLDIVTPLRLMQGGSPLRRPPFTALAGALLRRISSLAYYYGGLELDHDFKWLATKCREVDADNTGLTWVNWGGTLQGCVGELAISGDLAEILPFLRLGELLNVGKGAAYGMGSYSVQALTGNLPGSR